MFKTTYYPNAKTKTIQTLNIIQLYRIFLGGISAIPRKSHNTT